MSMKTFLRESTFAVLVNYTDIYFILCLINTGERTKVWPDELGKGFQDYVKLNLEFVVYVRLHVHLCPEDEARHKVEENIEDESRVSHNSW